MRGPFTIIEFADSRDNALIYVEDLRGGVTVRDDPDVTKPYVADFWALERMARPIEEFDL